MGIKCKECGCSGIGDEIRTCPECGAELDVSAKEPPPQEPGPDRASPAETGEPLQDQGQPHDDPAMQTEPKTDSSPAFSWYQGDEPPPSQHPGPPDSLSTEPVLAWEMPGNIFRRFWLTPWQVLIEPTASFKQIGKASYWPPVKLAFGSGLFYVATIPLFLFLLYLLEHNKWPLFEQMNSNDYQGIIKHGAMLAAFFLLGSTIFILFVSTVMAGCFHLFLKLYKGIGQPYIATYKVFAYWSSALFILDGIMDLIVLDTIKVNASGSAKPAGGLPWSTVISWLGFLIMLIPLVKGIASAHRTKVSKAIGAVLSGWAFFTLVAIGVGSIFFDIKWGG